MANQQVSHDLLVLEHVARTLSNVPVARLPYAVGQITSNLLQCKAVLSAEGSSSSKDASRTSTVTHKIRSRITSLLQDRIAAGRWSGIVLAKTFVELGGYQALQASGPWVTAIITVLKRPQDTASTKKLCCAILTRIFTLTRSYQTLQREITTPRLPDFINACLNHFSYTKQIVHAQRTTLNASVLEYMLQSINSLLPHHPTVFRSFADKLRRLSISILSMHSTQEDSMDREIPVNTQCQKLACELYVKLYNTAAKNGAAEEWDKGLESLCTAIRATSSLVLRAFAEISRSTDNTTSASEEPAELEQESIGFPRWTGIEAGTIRLVALLDLLKSFVATPTTFPVSFKTGPVIDLVCRILSVLPSQVHRQRQEIFNPQISKSEREAAIATVSRLQTASMEVFEVLLSRLGKSGILVADHLLDQLSYTFAGAMGDSEIRASVYNLLSRTLDTVGSCLDKKTAIEIEPVLMACCKDLLDEVQPTAQKAATNGSTQMVNPDALLNPSAKVKVSGTSFMPLHRAAESLLATALLTIPSQALTGPCRTKLEQVAVLTFNADAINAAAINPAQRGQGILPLAARIHPESLVTEVLVRPRMPVIQSSVSESLHNGGAADDVMTDEAHNSLDPVYDAYQTNGPQLVADPFMKPPVATVVPEPQAMALDPIVANGAYEADTASLPIIPATAPSHNNIAIEIPVPAQESNQSIKRAAIIEEHIPAEPIAKRMRVETTTTETVVPLPVNPSPANNFVEMEEDDDDIDEADIPPLVFKTDSEDEDEDDASA